MALQLAEEEGPVVRHRLFGVGHLALLGRPDAIGAAELEHEGQAQAGETQPVDAQGHALEEVVVVVVEEGRVDGGRNALGGKGEGRLVGMEGEGLKEIRGEGERKGRRRKEKGGERS